MLLSEQMLNEVTGGGYELLPVGKKTGIIMGGGELNKT